MKKTALQKYDVERWARSRIIPHPANPRVMNPAAEKRLRGKIKEVGMLEPVIVNRATSHLLGGHQRLRIMDGIEKYKPETHENDYELDVAVVDLEPKAELEMLAFLNNTAAQGDWDLEKLAALKMDFGASFEGMGFDKVDVDLLFDGDSRFSDLFKDSEDVKQTKEQIAKIKEAKKEAREKLQGNDSADFYFVVVCDSQAEKESVLRRLGVPHYEQFVGADHVTELIDKAAASPSNPAVDPLSGIESMTKDVA